MSDLRIHCCIAGCRRSWRDDGRGGEVICGRHYKMAPASLRNRFKRVKAAIRALSRKFDPRPSTVDRLYALEQRCWARIKQHATVPDKPVGLEAELDRLGVL